jgi:hypothetical protein
MEGNVVGVVASKLDAAAVARQTGDIPQNVNYAIKSQYLQELLERAGAALSAKYLTSGEAVLVLDLVGHSGPLP